MWRALWLVFRKFLLIILTFCKPASSNISVSQSATWKFSSRHRSFLIPIQSSNTYFKIDLEYMPSYPEWQLEDLIRNIMYICYTMHASRQVDRKFVLLTYPSSSSALYIAHIFSQPPSSKALSAIDSKFPSADTQVPFLLLHSAHCNGFIGHRSSFIISLWPHYVRSLFVDFLSLMMERKFFPKCSLPFPISFVAWTHRTKSN
jgi:hypothetical protein